MVYDGIESLRPGPAQTLWRANALELAPRCRVPAGNTAQPERRSFSMPTRTQPARRATTGRFARPAGSPAHRPTRRAATASRRTVIVARRKPQKTGMAKMMESVGAALPGAAKSSRGSGGKGKGMGAGLAVLAGAAGLAIKNRGRIQGMLRRNDQERMAHADRPAHPTVEVQPGGGPAGTGTPNATDTGVGPGERPAT